MGQFGIGQAVRRLEDERFLTGKGRYLDDLSFPNLAHAVFLRSPFANARITRIDTRAAASAPGVFTVMTGDDWRATGFGGIPTRVSMKNRDGSPIVQPDYPPLAMGCVHHVGQCVAMVVAETRLAAQDAVELIEVEYDELAAVSNAQDALKPGAPSVRSDVPDNLCFDWETGDAQAVQDGLASATHTVSISLHNNRLVANPIEPRGAIGHYDAATGLRTLEGQTS